MKQDCYTRARSPILIRLTNRGKFGTVHQPEEIGPALARLRKKAHLTQEQVGVRIGRSKATAAAIESPRANPQLSSILRYLAAVGATLGDLNAELSGDAELNASDPVEDIVRLVDQRLRDEPLYRRSMAEKLERFGTGSTPAIEELKARVARLEKKVDRGELPADGEQPLPNGTEE